MKKLSLLIGTLGGGLAGYLFSNKKLRDQIANAKDGEEAARLLGLHLQKDGKKLAKQIQEFIESEEVKKNVKKAKKFAEKKVDEAKRELDTVIDSGSKKAKKAVKNAKKSARSTAKRAAKTGKAKEKKTASKARKGAKKTVRRMKTNVRKVS